MSSTVPQFGAKELVAVGKTHIGNGLSRMTDLVMESGEGSYLYTTQGRYLDFSSGIGR